MTEWITGKLGTHLKIFRLCWRSYVAPTDVSKRSLSKAQRNQQTSTVSKASCLLMPCFYGLYKWDKKILLYVQFNWLKSSMWKGCLLASNTMVRNLHVLLLWTKKILPVFLIYKTKLMPQGNFAKCTIYINAFFWNSTVHNWAPVWILPILGSKQIGMTSWFMKFTGSEQWMWCIQSAQFCWVMLDILMGPLCATVIGFLFSVNSALT